MKMDGRGKTKYEHIVIDGQVMCPHCGQLRDPSQFCASRDSCRQCRVKAKIMYRTFDPFRLIGPDEFYFNWERITSADRYGYTRCGKMKKENRGTL